MKLADWFKHYLANVPRTPENCELWDRISEAAAALSAQQGGVRVPKEPAAWRWRYSPEHQWHYVEREHQRSAQAYDWEPVYTAPKQKEGKP